MMPLRLPVNGSTVDRKNDRQAWCWRSGLAMADRKTEPAHVLTSGRSCPFQHLRKTGERISVRTRGSPWQVSHLES